MNNQLLSSSSIVGTNVSNHRGEDLGHVKDLMIDTTNGEIQYAVLSFGGILGLGDKLFAVPFKSFTINRKDEKFVLNHDKEYLQNAPGFDKENWPNFADKTFSDRISGVYKLNATL